MGFGWDKGYGVWDEGVWVGRVGRRVDRKAILKGEGSIECGILPAFSDKNLIKGKI